ncbi:AAA family ATPase [Herbaspirillum sp. 1173]|uniref:AAA family ATPase n=1 Tax=Herbaspirillum sp. 1173 TaxID=2817734 RepID=UPI00286B8E77|nr:AAA family ATPase [Herbaspirillum sp. 1173]
MSDALRKIFEAGALSPKDVQDMALFAKSDLGLKTDGAPQPQVLDASTLPAPRDDVNSVALLALKEPQHLNAIDSAQTLSFEADGLTIIYGYNGAGKSGYARALKKACRARNNEAIVPNVFSPPGKIVPASAFLEWRADGKQESARWTDGTTSPAPLSRIAVFDSLCARVFVDDQAEVSYVPFGMDVLKILASAMQDAQKLVDTERARTQLDRTKFAALAGTHSVGRMISGLSRKTDVKQVTELAVLTGDEQTELSALIKQLREEDPAQQAQPLKRLASRIQNVQTELEALELALSDVKIDELRIALTDLRTTEAASKIAADELREGGKALEGTGSEPWEVLLRSAMAFAASGPYPEIGLPGPEDGASCVLCQQPLSADAHQRLQKFLQFLEADAQTKFAKAREKATRIYKDIAGVKLDTFPSDKVLFEELKEKHPEAISAIANFIESLRARQTIVKEMAAERRIGEIAPLPPPQATVLAQIRETLSRQAAILEQALKPEERAAKTARLAELEARRNLGPLIPTIHEAVATLQLDHVLSEASRGFNTTGITRKISELYEKYVTGELTSRLTSELTELGLSNVKIGLELAGQRGMRVQKLKLGASSQFSKVKLSDVLSEGEQRAIALAAFLAEIGVEPGKSGIIFDDPVSSLDHVRRERIADRLAKEGKDRQVIVFTHDLAFAWSLRESAERFGVKHAERHVYAAGALKGYCGEALPFEGKRLDARVNELKTFAAKAKKTLEQEHDHETYNDMVRAGYRRMRDTWELLVEELMFAGAVKRFRRSIETKKLRMVSVEDDDVAAVFAGMTRCSNFTHEGGAEAPPPLPEPDAFIADIDNLCQAVANIIARNKEVEKRREAAGISA